ncbi:hypothetical protein [Clostridium tyrobutyricum]|uniref:hypothetical protein n=1 Tax=Clostridium tyrobutyricum TaxID=1519 RepID=UPI00073D5278|nr:hypothetical protein [Clostridium tyrobutyricum]
MAISARVQVINEVCYDESAKGEKWVLCLQWCRYIYNDGSLETGFRFIWRRPDGTLQAARGQARIPNLKMVEELMEKAKIEGWAHNKSDEKEKIDNR